MIEEMFALDGVSGGNGRIRKERGLERRKDFECRISSLLNDIFHSNQFGTPMKWKGSKNNAVKDGNCRVPFINDIWHQVFFSYGINAQYAVRLAGNAAKYNRSCPN